MTVREASLEDINEIEKVERDNFTPEDFGMSRTSLRYHLKRNILFVVEEKGRVVGYCLWLRRKEYYRLYSIAILQESHAKGFGKMLLDYSIKKLRDKALQLEVKQINLHAVSLYKKFGFKIVKTLRSYYPNGIDGYLMKRAIS